MSEKPVYNIHEFVQLFVQRKNADENNLIKLVEEYEKVKKEMTAIKKKLNKNKPEDQKKKKKEKPLNKVINVDKLQNELIKIAEKLNNLAGRPNDDTIEEVEEEVEEEEDDE